MKPRFNLPEITFTEKSAKSVETEILANYAALSGGTLAAADPRRIFLQAIVPIIAQQRSLIDFSAKQNLLGYSTDGFLDHLGAFSKTERLPSSAAVTTVRLTLAAQLTQAKSVDAGVQVTAGDNLFFVLPAFTVLPNQPFVDVEAQCTKAGTIGNGYAIGQINKLVKPLAWVASVENITESDGGAETESDDPYAERIRIAPESFSTAGPEGAYEYWSKTASPLIVDVSIDSPSPGVVAVRTLLAGGEMPTQEILDAVFDILNTRRIRPLTDNVLTLVPDLVGYEINATYWIKTDDSKTANSIQIKIIEAIEGYKVWQKSKLGRDIDPSELITCIKNAGAKRVAVTLPLYQKLEDHQVASEVVSNIVYGGLEDE